MAATETFQAGAEQFTVAIDIDLGSEIILTGDIDTVVAAGTVARLRGVCRLLNNLHVRGTLVADPTGVDLDGQGLWDIHTHDGGVLNVVGTEKTAWCRWGDTPVGWNVGDRLVVAPTAVGVYVPTESTWQGSWAATSRPTNSPDVMLVDGSVARPEVVNLSQTLVFRNVTRIMLHESDVPNVHTFKWMKALNCGKFGELTFYPIHFHLLADTCRGSLLEGVVVEGGKNHAFVPHGSHGITFKDCVAYNTTSDAFWWDLPQSNPANYTDDAIYDHCLALWVKGPGVIGLSAFLLGAGTGNVCVNSTASCVQGGDNSSGFHWPSQANQKPNVWEHHDNVAHNNKIEGIFTWQNDPKSHVIERFTAYNHGVTGIDHGAYVNRFHYRDVTISGSPWAVLLHSLSSQNIGESQILEWVHADGPLLVFRHSQTSNKPTVVRECTFTGVTYDEWNPNNPPGSGNPSVIHYLDCGLVPADFTFTRIHASSIIEIWEAGVLEHQWAGAWI